MVDLFFKKFFIKVMVDFLLSEGYKFQLVKDEYTNHEFYQVLHEVP